MPCNTDNENYKGLVSQPKKFNQESALLFFQDNLVVLFNQPQTCAQSNSADSKFFQQVSLF